MTTPVHFVGSIACDTAEDVFRTVGATVKPYLRRCPDGEPGARRLWISYQWPLLRATAFLEADESQLSPGLGLCLLRLKAGKTAEDVHFSELGYAREARASYQDFLRARRDGLVRPDARFQVSLPTPIAVIGAFVQPQDVAAVLPAYTEAMIREATRVCASIPHEDLAVQWDVCIEMIQWDGRVAHIPPPPNMEQLFAEQFARLCAPVPAGVELGFHLCYGDLDAKHFVQPEDLGKAVELANLILANAGRPVNWVHMPVPVDRDDDAYFEPLRKLKREAGTELYLGLVHIGDGVEGALRRMDAASRFAGDFGIATECGFGRARTPDMAAEIMRIHADAAEAFPRAGP